jgi:3,4-dihydroxy 2-butanone 4-phosphate synthase/GTP cyclohydrolase II
MSEFELCLFTNNQDDEEHLALVLGDVQGGQDVLVRVHSECFTGDVLGSRRCDCGEQLQCAMHVIAEAGNGLIIYLRQEGRGIGLLDKLRAYNLQDQGYDTVEANIALGHQADERDYRVAAGILENSGIRSIRLLTNNPGKISRLEELGVTVTERVPLETTVNEDNAQYLFTKAYRMNHLLNLEAFPVGELSGENGNGSHR